MKLWLDDIRPPPDSTWTWAKSSAVAIGLLSTEDITHISFDHDLGAGKDGYFVARLIEFFANAGVLPRLKWTVHSANPVGRANIEAAMRKAEYFWSERESK